MTPLLSRRETRVEASTSRYTRHEISHHHHQSETRRKLNGITPETERRYTGSRRKQALTQSDCFITFASFSGERLFDREIENSSRNEASPSLTLHTPSSLN
ncbi:hypothetical protein F2Q69_00040739 [Brassica cretica]|uniref:Uncharacterized protein n=1 Tax=Brassica cretica TaxID=69181 RepID=A0A8S9NRP9_BRACR|nr:hypothetical protein F2Q69_00040739 [Brassica cretica]